MHVPLVHRSRRRLAALALTGAVVLAGCATGTTTTDIEPASSPTAAATTDAPSSSPAASATATPADAGTDAGSESASGMVTVDHAQGSTEVPTDPATVVVFDMGAMDTLTALDVELAGVPDAVYPDYLADATADVEKVGSLFEPDYEAVNALDPDLIIVGSRSSTVYEDLSAIAPTIDLTVDWEDYANSFREQTMALGPIFGVTDEIEATLGEYAERIQAVNAAAAEAGDALVVMTSAGEVTAYGPGSRFGMIHDVLGVTPTIADVEAETHGEAISFEFIAEADPDWLFVVDRDVAIGEAEGNAAEQVLDNELVASTTAWSDDQVVYLSSSAWYVVMSGLQTVDVMISEIESALS